MKTISTKQNISLHVARVYIESLSNCASDLLNDEIYAKAFNALQSRVLELLEPPIDGDIVETYVVVECEA